MGSVGQPAKFANFDDPENYKGFEEAILNETTTNFAIEFDSETARAAVNLDHADLRSFLNKERPSPNTRWINIFAPDKQREIVQHIARLYKFSPRLGGIMCSKKDIPVPVAKPSSDRSDSIRQSFGHSRKHVNDPEKHGSSDPPLLDAAAAALDLSHYKLIDEVWHYCSVDFGSRSLCIGYNSLTNIESHRVDASGNEERGQRGTEKRPDLSFGSGSLPFGKRFWSWLIICDDGTVISMLEDPNPFPPHCDKSYGLKIIRRNLLNVFKQLSNVNNEWRKRNPILSLDIRPGQATTSKVSKITINDSPGLLFYYLFDDWYTSYALVAKKEQQYAARLENLRSDLFDRPEIGHLKSLHQAGRQLAVLKRMYESYALIISRILDKQTPSQRPQTPAARPDQSSTATQVYFDNTFNQSQGSQPLVKDHVTLTNEAVYRFERLLDRINLYALTEIQDCLEEKEALVFLNFNLINLKESFAVEKLTRITILLAKATILFLPVSLMTGYFSTQIQDLQGAYTHKTYWASFAVIFGLSFIFLLIFGLVSGTIEGTVVYRPISHTVWNGWRGFARLARLKMKQK